MEKRVLLIFGLLVIIQGQGSSSFTLDFGDIREILVLGREITIDAMESAEWIKQGSSNDSDLNFPFIKKMERKLMEQIGNVNRKLDNFQERLDQRANDIVDILVRELPRLHRLESTMSQLQNYLVRVDYLSDKFEEYSRDYWKYDNYTMRDFASSCVSSTYGALPDLLTSIHRLVVPSSAHNYERTLLVQLARIDQVIKFYDDER